VASDKLARNMPPRQFGLPLVLFLGLGLCAAVAQQNCPLPPSLQSVHSAENMFSDQQEVDLGDAMAESVALHVNIIQNDELSGHLRDLGNRLVQHLPPTHLNFRFYLVDLPQVNAFSIAGGRVYISRKIVAFAHNDDEIAGILAHELGHIVTHQSAIEMTRAFREMLGVTSVGDRNDVFLKFHQYFENASRHARRGHGAGEKHQVVADQVEVFTLARAGFSPQAAADIWDRFNELHGKTGSWFSDLFGATTAAQHRLREMIKNTGALPAGCTDRPAALDEASFKAWQEAVVDYDNAARPETLPGLMSKHRLSARLRSEITTLGFSPDGKYILAQDDGGINVVKRDPFEFLFYIPASDAHDAKFSPDSGSVVFFTTGLRVETWGIAEHKRKSVHEITLREACLQSELSPDGTVLACLNAERALQLIDVTNSSVIYQRREFFNPSFFEALNLLFAVVRDEADQDSPATGGFLQLVNMEFTPGGHYFLAAHGIPTSSFMYDLAGHREMSVPGAIKDLCPVSFTFLGPDRIVGINPNAPQKSRILRFPSGETVDQVQLWPGLRLRGATHGNAMLVGPLKDFPLGIMDLTTKDNRVVIRQVAADIYDGVFVTERLNGELALHTKDSPQPLATLKLPESNLGRLPVGVASADLNYLAVSSRTRAAVWDLPRDFRVLYTRRFNAAGFDHSVMYADFPKFGETPRKTGELQLESGALQGHDLNDQLAVQRGLYLLVTKPRNKNGTSRSNVDLEVRDVRSGSVLWAHYFADEIPSITLNPDDATVMFRWGVSQAAAHNELPKLSQLKERAQKDDYLCEVLDAKTGNVLSALIIKSNNGSLHFLRGSANRNWAVMEAAGDQIMTYPLPAGEDKGHFFGSRPVLSMSGLLAVDSEKREVTLYDLSTSEPRQQYTFAEPIACKAFSRDGKRLLVFTTDQTVYLLDTTTSSTPEPALANNPVK